MISRSIPAFLAFLILAASLPAAEAVLPTREINDVLWCVDQTSRTVQDSVRTYAAWLAATYDANYRAIKCKLHQRPPIVIDGSQLGTVYGPQVGIVRGTGTGSDPYVIENWEIAGSDSFTVYPASSNPTTTPTVPEYNLAYTRGILIKETTKHFVIKKVYVHGFGCASCSGITLDRAPNVRIEDVVLLNNRVGIWSGQILFGGPSITGSTILGGSIGIHTDGTRPFIANNFLSIPNGDYGIRTQAVDRFFDPAQVHDNEIHGPRTGVGIIGVHWGWYLNNRICATQQMFYVSSDSERLYIDGNWC